MNTTSKPLFQVSTPRSDWPDLVIDTDLFPSDDEKQSRVVGPFDDGDEDDDDDDDDKGWPLKAKNVSKASSVNKLGLPSMSASDLNRKGLSDIKSTGNKSRLATTTSNETDRHKGMVPADITHVAANIRASSKSSIAIAAPVFDDVNDGMFSPSQPYPPVLRLTAADLRAGGVFDDDDDTALFDVSKGSFHSGIEGVVDWNHEADILFTAIDDDDAEHVRFRLAYCMEVWFS